MGNTTPYTLKESQIRFKQWFPTSD